MMDPNFDDDALASAAKIVPPPPAADLLRQVGAMKAVKTRARFGAFGLALAIGLVWPALTLIRFPLRPDLRALPPAWIAAGAGLWGLALLASLKASLVPARGDVLPSAPAASRTGVASMLALLAFCSLATITVPGVSLGLEDAHVSLPASCLRCGGYVLLVAGVFIAVGYVALRKVLPIGGGRIGMALGAAGGAAGGLALHFHCPIAVTSHVVFGHIGGVILSAIAGGLLLYP